MSQPQVPRPMGIVDPLLGKVLDGRYRILEKVGEGGMSSVYLAEPTDGSGRVAIKVLHDHLVSNADQKERFEREARALFGLEHPHILKVHDFGVHDGLPYLVMELLDGISLDAYVEQTPPDPDAALAIAREILEGLAFAHRQGALHRDLKTENVFLARTPSGLSVRLLDFGLVKFVDDERWGSGGKALTAFGEVFGTPAYMSPEQATGAPVGQPSDVYAMGVVLYELLTGQWPFMEETRVDMVRAHMLKPAPPLTEARPDLEVRPELEALVQKAMAKEPTERFADAAQMLAALDAIPRPAARVRGAGPPMATHQPTWVPTERRAPAGRPAWLPIALGVGVAGLLLVVAITVLLFVLG